MEIAFDPPATSSAPFIQAANPKASEPQKTSHEDQPRVASEKASQARMQDMKNGEQAEQVAKAERKKAEATDQRRKATERDRHRRHAERKARQEAALEQQTQEQHHQDQRQALRRQDGPFGLLAFRDGSQLPRQSNFFGN